MVDASFCRGMEFGSPQVSLAALRELREVVRPSPQATAHPAPGLVSCLKKEKESGEPYAEPAVAAAVGVREHDCAERGRKAEAIRTLADLLLEAVGQMAVRAAKEGTGDEPKNQA